MFSLLPKLNRKETARLKVRPFDPRNLGTLLSWTKSARELRMWAGETFPKLPDEMTFRTHLNRHGIRAYQAADRRGRFVGYAELVGRTGGDGILCRVIIDPARRGIGSGKALVELLSDEAFRKIGFKRLLLNVFTFNTPALRCYRALGFRPLLKRPKPRSFQGECWDLVVMQKDASAKAA